MADRAADRQNDEVAKYLAKRKIRNAQPLVAYDNYFAHVADIKKRGNPAYSNSYGNGPAGGTTSGPARDANGAVIPGVTYDPTTGKVVGGGGMTLPVAPASVQQQAAGAGVVAATAANAQESGLQQAAATPPPGVAGPEVPVDEHGVKTAFKNTTHWLSDLFNPDDESDLHIAGINLSGVESVFDGALTALGMAADTAAWGLTGAYLAMNPNYWQNRDQGIEGNLWQDATRVSPGQAWGGLSGYMSSQNELLGTIASRVAAPFTPPIKNVYADNPNMDIADEQQMADFKSRQEVLNLNLPFESSIDISAYDWQTGAADAAITLVADPANVAGFGAGKLAKLARVRYLNKPIVTVQDTERVTQHLDDGHLILDDIAQEATDAGGVSTRNIEDILPEEIAATNMPDEARFAWEVSARRETPDSIARRQEVENIADEAERNAARDAFIPEYEKRIPLSTIVNHDTIRWATNRDALSAALYNADTYEEAALILRHAAGDKGASQALSDIAPRLFKDIVDGERDLVNRMLAVNPKLVGEEITKWDQRYIEMVNRLDDLSRLNASPEAVAAARQQLDDIQTMWESARKGALDPVGVGPLASADELDLARRALDEQLAHNDLFLRSLTDAGGKPNGDLLGAMRETPIGGYADTGRSILPGAAGAMSEELAGRMMARMGTSRMNRAARRALSQGRGGRMGAEIAEATGIGGKAAAAARSIGRGLFTVDEFYGVSGRNPIARVLNWAGGERQSGLIYTSGLSAQESAREVRAMLNGVDIYSGKARKVTAAKMEKRDGKWVPVKDKDGKVIMEEVEVGGLAAKEKMIEQYQNAMLIGGSRGDMQVRALIDEIEEQILVDIARAEGLDPELLRQVHYRQNRKLEKIEKEIREKGYWTDEKGSRNYAPYLESQLQNQSFLKDWRSISGVARQFARRERAAAPAATRMDQAAYGATGAIRMTGRTLDNLNSAMQEFWRPSVLLRLGYTQRNVAEGLFRSTAFHWSLMPVVDAARQWNLSSLNFGSKVGRANARAAEIARMADEGTEFAQMPRRFQRWREKQIEAADHQIVTTQSVIADGRARLAQESAAYRTARAAELEARVARLQDVHADLQKQLLTDGADETRLVPQMDDVVERIAAHEEEVRALRAMTGGDDAVDPAISSLADTLDTLENVDLEFNRSVRASLDDVNAAALAYKRQTMAKRRVYGKDSSVGDPDTLEGVMRSAAMVDPFAPKDRFAEIAWQAMSADHTMRQQASMRMKAVTDALALQETRYYVAVDPSDATYFDGVATVLNQFQNSEVGKIAIAGRAANKPDMEIIDDIVRFLYEDGRGQEVAAFINQANDIQYGGTFESATTRSKAARRAAMEKAKPLQDEVDGLVDELAEAEKALVKARLTAGTLAPAPPAKRAFKTVSPSGSATKEFAYGEYRVRQTGRGAWEVEDAQGVVSKFTNQKDARATVKAAQDANDEATRFAIEQAGPSRAAYDEALAAAEDLRARTAAAQSKLDELIARESVPKPREGAAAGRMHTGELDDARYYGEEVLRRYDQVTDGNIEFQQYLAANPQLPMGSGRLAKVSATTKDGDKVRYRHTEAGTIVRQYLDGSTTLKPVVGNMATFVGEASALDIYHRVIGAGFKALGTIPEDLFVRSQFYGRTFRKHAESMYDSLVAQSDSGIITWDDVNAIRNQSHRRALKDTKDWLYTIDRRTNLGSAMERFVPFISASQNSVTTVGRLIYKDPTTAWAMATIWQLPDRFGDMDGDGNPDTFAIPIGFLPDGVQESIAFATGTKKGQVQFNKTSFDLVFNGVFDPQGPPLVGVLSSEMMKHGWFGAQGDTPEWLDSIPDGDLLWGYWKDYSLGKEGGASEYFASVDKILAPWQKRMFDAYLAGPGSSANYSRTYQSYMLQEQWKYRNGEREDEPTQDEILNTTNNIFKLRALANLTLFTTPKYDTEMDALANAINKQDQLFRQDQSLPPEQRQGVLSPEEMYGDLVAQAGFGVSKSRENKAGVQVTDYGAAAVKANEDVIRQIAPSLVTTNNLDAIGILTEDPNSFFADPSSPSGYKEGEYQYSQDAAAYFAANRIPGTNEEYRAAQDPATIQHQAMLRVAWRDYMIQKEALEIDMQQKGVSSMETIEGMQYKNILKYQIIPGIEAKYPGFMADKAEQEGSRSNDVLRVMATAFNTPAFVERNKSNPVWSNDGPAATYMRSRTQYMQQREAIIMDARSKGVVSINTDDKGKDVLYRQMLDQLQEDWNLTQAQLRRSSPAWAALQDRYIGDDSDPRDSGSMTVQYEEAS
jgi:hypothetical protein